MDSCFFDSLQALPLQTPPTPRVHHTLLLSGGQDSATLLWCSAHGTPADRYTTTHYNHLWHEDTMPMAEHVLTTSFWFNVVHRTVVPTAHVPTEHGASVWRKQHMASLREATCSSPMYLNGHTHTDQMESNLFRELRIASRIEKRSNAKTRSINGPPHRRQGPAQRVQDIAHGKRTPTQLKRPLHVLTRETTRFIVQAYRVPIYPDRTNVECTSTRAQIRYILWPLLFKCGFHLR